MRKKSIIFIAFIASILSIILCYFGVLCPNKLFAMSYPVHGIDVSHYQKDIDWKRVAQNKNIKFVYMKASEGKEYEDDKFLTNWNSASQVGLIKGAYHYFKVTSTGKDQAMNFIKIVPSEEGCLPPAIDIEEKGLDKDKFQKELHDYITLIKEKYKQTPVLYVTYPLYKEFIKGEFDQYPIWIRDIIKPPRLGDKKEWTFWQYCDKGRIEGITTYVDLDVFHGDLDELKMLLSKKDMVKHSNLIRLSKKNNDNKISSPIKETGKIKYNNNLCKNNEEVLFSFTMAKSRKKLSVCVSKKEPDYIVYRFGTKDKIELEFPENKDDSWRKFTYSYYFRGGRKGNEGLDLNYLSFENAEFQYKIYYELSTADTKINVGIKIIDKDTKKETDRKGLSKSIKGDLINLRRNEKIKIEDES